MQDWKHIDNFFDEGALVGCDYSGIVEEVGPDITKQFKKGVRIRRSKSLELPK